MPMSFYITTPIYYVNDTPHIGHAYTTIVADVLTRYHRLFGDQSFFLTGTDEHGQKVEAAAKKRGVSPLEHCDEMVKHFEQVWQELGIDHDIFMRTTAGFHKEVVQQCLQMLFDKGEIYQDTYEGWYSVSEEIFYTEKDLVDGKSPFGKEVTKVSEKNYFFRMSKYQQKLIDYINANSDFVQPPGKKSEVLGFLKQPLGDLCISRPKSRLSWGIELPFDTDFVTYVWFDALLNYVSALGYSAKGDSDPKFDKFWPGAVHLIGKDILTTHTVYWPTMLMALEIPLPKTIFAHGWWLTADAKKMSKSEGPVVDPLSMKDIVGVDELRYYFLRDAHLGNDAQFSPELVVNRVNSELANNLGNLFSRTVNLICKNFDGEVPELICNKEGSLAVKKLADELPAIVESNIREFKPDVAIGEIVSLLDATNRYIDEEKPWAQAKESPALAQECLTVSLEALRFAATLLLPVMPTKAAKLLEGSGIEEPSSFSELSWGDFPSSRKLQKPKPLFPRVDLQG